ncbi:hypothetical protein [Vulcanisaeta souniana]|uniref:Uncharacterized protein n=1 Tax=Vulcanisaeta souniana JCM 11219 TaxID=1293586 RepID=A0A830E585_9CREN|nr:hypothetical protein [Vulcanisaeta souniana]BDR92745.1 hypothetical protein Vsou_18380 [Vulcanisaeta souniana JCM 11219]GGI84011.1 hypothetical protein GCM10007112_21120 [Vulcanisaeta souniana JCM 11219]
MGLIECIIISTLKKLGRTSLDRLAKIVFLVDRFGDLQALNWDRIDLVITSPDLIGTVEQLTRNGVIKNIGDFLTLANNDYDPGCGWIGNTVESTINYVLEKYGQLSDGELDDIVESVYEGVY